MKIFTYSCFSALFTLALVKPSAQNVNLELHCYFPFTRGELKGKSYEVNKTLMIIPLLSGFHVPWLTSVLFCTPGSPVDDYVDNQSLPCPSNQSLAA